MSYPPREGSRDIGEALIISNYPDYCRSPKDIIPYNIFAYQSDDANTATSVRFTGKKAHTTGSIETCCYGDEAGVGLGVSSGTQLSICEAKTFSKTVRIEGKHALRHGDTCYMNNRNTTGKVCYVKDVKTYQPTPQIKQITEQRAEKRYTEQAHVFPSVESSIPTGGPTDKIAIKDTDFQNIGGEPGQQLAQITIPTYPTPLPFYLPPVTQPGTKENNNFVKNANDLSNSIRQYYINKTIQNLETIASKNNTSSIDSLYGPYLIFNLSLLYLLTYDNVRVTSSTKTKEDDKSEKEDCRKYACPEPLPGQKYRGGAYGCMKLPWGDGLEAHHMPANAYTQLPRDAGPAIQMLPEHHWETASNPKNTRGARYDVQIELLAQGEFMNAFYEDISDAEAAIKYSGGDFGDYTLAITQVEAYAECLERTGIVR